MTTKPAPVRVDIRQLRQLVKDLFAAAGASADDAGTVADVLAWANQRGVDSHGVSRIPRYLELFESGEANAKPRMTITRPRPGLLVIDADRAPGPVALCRAVHEGIAVAREQGSCWVSVRDTVHAGAIGYYTQLAADQGFAALGVLAGVPNMGYTGAKGAAVATSPLSIAMPAARHATPVLDMATAAIALGKIAQYKARGEPLPPNAALTADGEPTTDAALAEIPLPAAGAKGAGLSLMIELLCGVLTGSPIVSAFHGGTPEGRRHRQNGSFLLIDIAALRPLADVKQGVDATIDAVKSLPQADADTPILYPGERGAKTYAKRAKDGVPVPAAIWKKLVADAERLGVSVPTPLPA